LNGSEEIRARALKLYSRLYASIPEHSFKKKLRELEK
jgi:hypothetical protein